MGEANQGKTVQTKLSKLDDENPRNLLLRFSPEKPKQTQLLPNSEPQLDLSLRLSLGGGYSELFKEKPITRSSSVDGIITEKVNACESDSTLPGIFLSLQRSCSLPVDNVQGQIKLKDMQTKRRTEAQKRLVEKQRRGRAAPEEAKPSAEATVPPPTPTSEVAAWAVASAARSPAFCRAIIKIKTEGFVSGHRKLEDGDVAAANGAHSSHSLPNPMDTNPVVIPGATANGISVELSKPKLENLTKKVKLSKGCYQDNGMDVMRQMPSVTTTGDGPNGKKIEGFLYKYTRGQVSIVCVCHGSFLSPAEFVEHAGGKDVKNPMKHINVFPSF
ncbi:hypothetical protein F2P56_019590 [Juglans regia]|uniref:Ninja-family protein n=2 Tax=Juglans regia TaxID=51240 RepID=A0A6P9EQA8_JUGRE|nr:ninja-family protein AFP3-like [Juglans regia]XP_035549790.1 ninja-family protein AFP3-like [Juglans regia]KAF5459662.1 hypothetical protein F2P56_019590 [Juglans regia]